MAATVAFRFAPVAKLRFKEPPQPHYYPARILFPIATPQFRPPATHQPPPSLASLCRRGALSVNASSDKNGAPQGDSVVSLEQEYEELKRQSALPERYRSVLEFAPEKPARWPWLIPLPFLIYSWRAVLWELSNWMRPVLPVVRFMSSIGMSILSLVSIFILEPVTALIQCIVAFPLAIGKFILMLVSFFILEPVAALMGAIGKLISTCIVSPLIQCIEFPLYFLRPIYFSIVAYAPVLELSTILLLTSSVLAIAEAASPDSVNSQQGLLIAAGLVGFGAVRGFLPEAIFWLSLMGFFSYSRFVKKRDVVAAFLPSVAALTAVGEPWLRALSLSAYLAFSIFEYSKTLQADKRDERTVGNRGGPPIPLVLAALAIGINISAMWIRRRHQTWMIV